MTITPSKDSGLKRRFGPAALISGASDGIGRAFAGQLAEQGFDTILVAQRGDVLQEMALELGTRFGGDVHVLAMDLLFPAHAGMNRASDSASCRTRLFPAHSGMNRCDNFDRRLVWAVSAITCASGEASDIVKYSIKALLGALVRVLTDFQSDQHKIIAKELDSHPRLADGQRQCDGTPRAGGQHQPIDGRRPRCDLAEPCCLRVANRVPLPSCPAGPLLSRGSFSSSSG